MHESVSLTANLQKRLNGGRLPLHRFLPDEPLDDVLLRYNLLDETDYVLRHAMFKVARGRKQQCFAKVIVSHVAQ